MVRISRVVYLELERLLNISQARYSILLLSTWLTISALLFNIKYGGAVLTGIFTASFLPGYTQEVSVFLLPPWNRFDGFVAQV